MIAESTISSNHQRSSCYNVPNIEHRTATHAALPLAEHSDVIRRASPAHVRTRQTLAARDISLVSISEVSHDSLSRLVARIGCRVSLPRPTSKSRSSPVCFRLTSFGCPFRQSGRTRCRGVSRVIVAGCRTARLFCYDNAIDQVRAAYTTLTIKIPGVQK